MSTKTVSVTVQIQMDITKGENEVSQVQDVLELMNESISKAGIKAEPQIFISDISGADITDQDSDDDDDDEIEGEHRIVSQFGSDYKCVDFYCTDRNVGGVDVSREGEHIGEIIGISLPDSEDEEECEKFDNEVINWIVDNE